MDPVTLRMAATEIKWGDPEEVLAKARKAALVTDCKRVHMIS